MRRSLSRRARACAALVVAAALSLTTSAYAIRSGEQALFGPVSVADGQILRINVYGIGNPDISPWTFLVRILDAKGDVVNERRLQLRPGVSGAVNLRVGEAGLLPDTNGRRTLRAEIVGFNPQPDPPGDWFTTLEVIEAQTGRSTIMLGGPDTVPGSAMRFGSQP
jgi:hypothetical protein